MISVRFTIISLLLMFVFSVGVMFADVYAQTNTPTPTTAATPTPEDTEPAGAPSTGFGYAK
ncbi:MAG: hypothetical protein NUV98_00150 [Candidatus Roizmanbacteria bacterium]|nr:hypothetical protein [Candidatus Roizmanbacteria bacterium]